MLNRLGNHIIFILLSSVKTRYMSDTKKTQEQIDNEANKIYDDFKKELKQVREYQANNSVVKPSIGGLSFNLGDRKGSTSSKKFFGFSSKKSG